MTGKPLHVSKPRHRVFISHSSEDAAVAGALVASLEAVGISCWIAPRDVPTGSDYASEIVGAIREAPAIIFLVSIASNSSEHCLRELDIAVNAGIPLLPLRLDSSSASAGIEYRLSTVQWMTLNSEVGLSEVTQRLVDLGVAAHNVENPVVTNSSLRGESSTSRRESVREPQILAGRFAERKVIADTVAQVEATGCGQLLLIGGESGVGKSALTQELVRIADASGFRIVATSCGSFVETVSFYPVKEVMRQLVGYNDLSREIQRIYGTTSTQASMAAVIDSPVASPQSRREAMMGTFANTIMGCVSDLDRKPTVIVVDDAENIDAGSVDCLLCLLARLDEGPVLVVAIYRTDCIETEGRSHPIAPLIDAARRDTRHGSLMNVGPLRRADYPGVVEAILGGRLRASSRLLDYLWAETEGNALFLREIIHAVRAFGADTGSSQEARLVREGDEWRFLGTVDALETPKSVEDAIARNLDGIGADDRGYLELAAVIGKQFGFDIALGISGTDENELLDSLESSIGRSIIRELTEPVDSFEFSHSKIRDVLYNSLSKIRRKRIHSRIADLLAESPEAVSSDRDSLIGEHLYLAGRYAESADHLIRSAESLMAISDSRRAAIVYDRVLVALEKSDGGDPQDARLSKARLGRIGALIQGSEYARATELCQQLVRSNCSAIERGWAFDHIGDIEWVAGDTTAAFSAYASAEEIALSTDDAALELEVCADLTELHVREAERTAGMDAIASEQHRNIAEMYLERQYALALASADPWARARAYRNHAKQLRRSGDIDGALREYEASIDQTDPRVATHSVLISYAKTLRLRGDHDRARDVVTRVLSWSRQTGARRSNAIALYYRAIVTMDAAGATDAALEDIDNAMTLHDEIGYKRGKWEVGILRGEWMAQRGRWTDAVAEFRAAIVIDGRSYTEEEIVAAAVDTIRAIDEEPRASALERAWGRR